jgi:gamma-tubulin complex component 4
MNLLRLTCSVGRDMLWFLDTLMGHFQTDVIETQYTRLFSHLHDVHEQRTEGRQTRISGPTPFSNKSTRSSSLRNTLAGRSSSPDTHFDGDASTAESHVFPHGPGPTQISGTAPPSEFARSMHHQSFAANSAAGRIRAPLAADKRLDFADLRATHVAFLKFLQDGLLLNAPRVLALVRAILDTCVLYVGHIERWGGDVLPDLLAEGSLEDGEPKTRESAMLKDRNETIARIVIVS